MRRRLINSGTLITKDDIERVRVPLAMACVEDDTLFPEDVLAAGRKSLEGNGIDHEVVLYPAVPHGEYRAFPNGKKRVV
jgi:dienelactone hydrolase